MGNLVESKLFNLLFILTLISSSCASEKNSVNRIIFATGGCYGKCAVQVIDINSTLNVKYHGIDYTKNSGYFTGTISQSLWDSLTLNLERINYKKLDSVYDHTVDDLSTELYVVYDNNKIKNIRGREESLPKELMEYYIYYFSSTENFNLVRSPDTLSFPINMKRLIGKPELDGNIKFPPPVIDTKKQNHVEM